MASSSSTRLVVFPLGEGVFGVFFGDHHGQHEGTHVSTGLCGRGEQAFMVGAKALGVLTPTPKQKL